MAASYKFGSSVGLEDGVIMMIDLIDRVRGSRVQWLPCRSQWFGCCHSVIDVWFV